VRSIPDADHLKLIQQVIERMGRNSFALKGFSVSAAAALLGLAAADSDRTFAVIAAAAAAIFWMLDAYYLATERKYVQLYNAKAASENTDWSLSAGGARLGEKLAAAFAPQVLLVHGVAFVASVVVAIAG